MRNSPKHFGFIEKSRGKWEKSLPPQLGYQLPTQVPLFIAVGGGKGGVGKSLLSANLAAKFGLLGFKTLVLDLDIGGANLHTHFGLPRPCRTLVEFLEEKKYSLKETLFTTTVPNVSLVGGGKDGDLDEVLNPKSEVYANLWKTLIGAKNFLEVDIIICDLGAGTSRHTIDFFSAAHAGIVTVLPEPTSIENAYGFIKASLLRIVEYAGQRCNEASTSELVEAISSSQFGLENGIKNILANHMTQHPQLVRTIQSALRGKLLGIVINQIRSQRDIDVCDAMSSISKSVFGFESIPLGFLNYDDAAWKSLRNRRLLLMDFPHSLIAGRISDIANRLLQYLI